MAKVSDVQAAVDKLVAEVSETTTLVGSAKAAFNGLKAMIADLRQQLADAIASSDPAALQAVVDSAKAIEAELDARNTELSEAIVAGTAEEPPA